MFEFAVRLAAALATILLAAALGWLLQRKFGCKWSTYRTGALCFLSSQMLHIPFNALVVQMLFGLKTNHSVEELHGFQLIWWGIFLGLSAAFFEETSRWLFYKYSYSFAGSVTNKMAVMFGSGHGGCEALLIGIFGLVQLVGMTTLKNYPPENVPEDQAAMINDALNAYWSIPFGLVLMGPVERMWALSLHCSLSTLVWQSFKRNTWTGYATAVILHAIVDAFAVIFVTLRGALVAEVTMILTVFPLSLWILRHVADDSEDETEPLLTANTNTITSSN